MKRFRKSRLQLLPALGSVLVCGVAVAWFLSPAQSQMCQTGMDAEITTEEIRALRDGDHCDRLDYAHLHKIGRAGAEQSPR